MNEMNTAEIPSDTGSLELKGIAYIFCFMQEL